VKDYCDRKITKSITATENDDTQMIRTSRYVKKPNFYTEEKDTKPKANEKKDRILSNSYEGKIHFQLPSGWLMERISRKGGKTKGHVDAYYFSPVVVKIQGGTREHELSVASESNNSYTMMKIRSGKSYEEKKGRRKFYSTKDLRRYILALEEVQMLAEDDSCYSSSIDFYQDDRAMNVYKRMGGRDGKIMK